MDNIAVLESFIITEADTAYVNKSFGDKAKELGKKILDFFKKLINAVISFFARLVGTKSLIHSKAFTVVDDKMRESYKEVEDLVSKYEKNPTEFYNDYRTNDLIDYHNEWVDVQEEIRRVVAMNPDKKNYVRNTAFEKAKTNIINKLREFERRFSKITNDKALDTKSKTRINTFLIMLNTLTKEILNAYQMTTLGQRKDMVTIQYSNIASTKV